jgi:hypothetical protein
MGRTNWIVGLALCAGCLASDGAAAETIEPLTLKVLIMDEVGVPAETLRHAREEVNRIFERFQIGLVWVEDTMPQGRFLVVKIVSKAPSQKSQNPNMLGVAAGSQEGLPTHAWLFYDRILNQHRALHLDASLLLGHVMAHEMGHLLLPYGAHTAAGLMKGGWDTTQARLAAMGSLRFDTAQAAIIRARLLSAASTVARP